MRYLCVVLVLALGSPAAADPPAGAPCFVIEELWDGKPRPTRVRVWTDGTGRPIYKDDVRGTDAPYAGRSYTYDPRGFLVGSESWRTGGSKELVTFRYGTHGELLEIARSTDGGPAQKTTYTWTGTFRADAVPPAFARMVPVVNEYSWWWEPYVPGSASYDPPVFAGDVVEVEHPENTWKFDGAGSIVYQFGKGRSAYTRKTTGGQIVLGMDRRDGGHMTIAWKGDRMIERTFQTDEGLQRETSTYDAKGRWTGRARTGDKSAYRATPSCP